MSRINKEHGLILVLLLTFMSAPAFGQGWQGITPLTSTRSDVERILGQPTKSTANTSSFNFPGKKVFVVYSSGTCIINPEGWNVPQDTVTSLTITLDPKPRITELKLNDSYKLKRDNEVGDIAYYFNEDEGISYEVDTQQHIVKSITYSPTSKHTTLRCPDSGKSIVNTYKFGEYDGAKFDDEKTLLTDFARFLITYDVTDAYVIVYSAGAATDEEVTNHRQRIKEYLTRGLRVNVRRVKIIDGGCREKPSVELFIVPSGAYPPPATPDCESRRS